MRRLTWLVFLALAAPVAARAADDGDAAPAAAAPPAAPAEKPKVPPGYLPGYQRAMGLGLSPYAPQTPGLPGGLTIPFSAPAPGDDWMFNFWGYMSASLRVGQGDRDVAYADQHVTTLHTYPRIVDAYGMFNGTNVTQGSWVDLTFEYGNNRVTSHVKISTWKPAAGSDWTPLGSQNLFQEAYLSFKIPVGRLNLKWSVGAFSNTYGGLGQYDVGHYNAAIIGMPFGVGETLTAQIALDSTYTVFLEDGIMGRLAKVPVGAPAIVSIDGMFNESIPSSWVHHVHAGLARYGTVPLIMGLHWLTNWAQDERDQQDDPRTPFVDESRRPDPRMDVFGADFRMIDNYLGNFAAAVSYADAHYATLLTGLNYYGAFNGEQLTKRFLGPRDGSTGALPSPLPTTIAPVAPSGGGTGKMLVAGLEYNVGWGRLLRYPVDLGPNGPELTTSVFVNFVHLSSRDPDADGKRMLKFGAEATYRWLHWLTLSARADRVMPNSKDSEESFTVVSPKLIFKTDWMSHEQVTLAYTRWFYGAHTHAEFPNDFTRGQLDSAMYSLSFGLWW
ncbi:MAG TPA: hypothetical protein VMU50_00315 [Polyangia bacterium]|nr:hypothetical protein [Polyangia bacterium]